jgi:hypothetical protein
MDAMSRVYELEQRKADTIAAEQARIDAETQHRRELAELDTELKQARTAAAVEQFETALPRSQELADQLREANESISQAFAARDLPGALTAYNHAVHAWDRLVDYNVAACEPIQPLAQLAFDRAMQNPHATESLDGRGAWRKAFSEYAARLVWAERPLDFVGGLVAYYNNVVFGGLALSVTGQLLQVDSGFDPMRATLKFVNSEVLRLGALW